MEGRVQLVRISTKVRGIHRHKGWIRLLQSKLRTNDLDQA
jgi:hypothetical protein